MEIKFLLSYSTYPLPVILDNKALNEMLKLLSTGS